jgi:hypothetical protein
VVALATGFYGGLGGLETDFGMLTVTEWFVGGSAAAAQSHGRLAGNIKLVAIRIRELQILQIASHDERAILFGHDIDCH